MRTLWLDPLCASTDCQAEGIDSRADKATRARMRARLSWPALVIIPVVIRVKGTDN